MSRRYRGWRNCGIVGLSILALLIPASALHADGLLTGWIVKVEADKGALHDEYVQYFSGETLDPGGWFDWMLPGPHTFANGLGQLQSLTLSLNDRCYEPDQLSVELGFSLVSGSSGATFTVTSALLPITVANPEAYASAGVTVTDGEPYDTATLLGKYAGDMAFQASYNNGTPWKTLVPTEVVTGVGGTASSDDRYPAGTGWEVIPATVTDISSQYKFVLTPLDQASGTSNFVIKIPEPTTLALLCAGLLLARRRRHSA